ncbi:MAG: ABC-2 type transport system permease protein [Phenylobacterium sp.]|jgi:ABC-2 type transport system permease protein
MIIDIAKFEIERHLKSPSTYIYFVCYGLLTLLMTLLAGGAFESVRMSIGNTNILLNGAYTITATTSMVGVIGLITVGALMGQAMYQDFHHKMHSLVFVRPVTKGQLLTGRFLGTLVVLMLIFLALPLSAYLATLLGMIPESALGQSQLSFYMAPYFIFIVGNILWAGAIFFTLAALFRKMMPVYIGSLLLVLFWVISSVAINDAGGRDASSLIDPFGLQAAEDAARYWSVTERNTQLLTFTKAVLLNRLMWWGIGGLMLFWCYRRFDFVESLPGKKAKASKAIKVNDDSHSQPKPQIEAKASYGRQLFDGWSQRQALFALVKFELLQTLKNRYFLVLMMAALGFIVFASSSIGNTFGTITYPTSYMITDILGGGFEYFILIVLVFYAGELVWREKDVGIKQVVDMMPVPAAFAYISKLIALMSVVSLMLLMVAIAGVLIQASNGYYEFDLHVYFIELFVIILSKAFLLATLALFIQTVVGHKYAAHGLMVLIYVLVTVLPLMGIDSLLIRYAEAPSVMYSDMNGYGTYLAPHLWFKTYWLAFALILLQLTVLMWSRGEETVLANRLKNARNSLTLNGKNSFIASGLIFVSLLVYLAYNTLVVNPVPSSDDTMQNALNYEVEYRQTFEKMPQPAIINADFAVDIYANERSLKLAGTYTLSNTQQQPLTQVFINLPAVDIELQNLTLDRQYQESVDDAISGVKVLTFDQPLLPGEQVKLDFSFAFAPTGVSAQRKAARIFQNGTFLDIEYFPTIGFNMSRILQTDTIRARYNLGPVPELPDANSPDYDAAVMQSAFGGDTRWAHSNYVLSTDIGQTAISPGELVKQWTEGDRAYFEYQSTQATIFYPSVVSAQYAVKEAKWNDVAIQIFYHPRHDYNIDTLIRGVQQSLEVFSKEFGEYPFGYVRIIEFPRFSRFAQSFPGTIPYSEAIGFIARLSDSDDEVDYPFFVTAHEMAHQWWPHQTSVSATKGANMLSETLAQYSALVVMEHDLGIDEMRLFLRYGLDRYLSGRGAERDREVPLIDADNQDYILYDKGGIVMYTLRDYLGAELLHKILREYLNEFKYADVGHAYPTSVGLINRIRRHTPQEYQYLITDLFDNITLMDMRTTSATSTVINNPVDNGQYQLTMKGQVNKNRLTELGDSETIEMNDLIDVAVFDEAGKVIYLQKHRFAGGDFDLTIMLDKKPARAGVDAYHKLIDRVPDDNEVDVVEVTEE